MKKVSYISGDESLLDNIKELWEALNEHHGKLSINFKEHYNSFSFITRKEDLMQRASQGKLGVELAYDDEIEKYIGYCISSVDNNKIGEVESIFVAYSYRGTGVGYTLMEKSLKWMDEMGAVKKLVSVATGNEQAYGFYERFGFFPRKMILEQKKYDK